ncbi:hypothetical protein PAXINDRAFT_16962 [Paxillus involutus ATCC 200175]|uniref:Uncharacterized protein n=1 Tax=Paxillus involutus ATCC 200175 TaxID=664439 RepID=A0A0C9TS07_PAXIN|nr:hypothetical protein PAXINDRAFT_16962 [Paxillus involutus ATCC 200175]
MVYSAGSKSSPANKTVPPTNASVANYTIYSAQITSTPPKDIVRGLEEATKKKPPTSFPYEAIHASDFSKDEYQRVMQEGNEEGSIGSVFRGVQALCSEEGEGHASRLFVGQRTAQTSGSAIHLSSRFIPTVERASIDLVNGQVAEWNAELLYVGGLLTRFIYEQAMKDIGSRWPESPSLTVDGLREEALYTMGCFTFRQSTPDSKVGQLLQDAFFNCSASKSFPILSNIGIRNSKDIREPHADFQSFMKACPSLDSAWWPARSPMIQQLPEKYQVKTYKFRAVRDELKGRAFTEEEMIACVSWWVKIIGTKQQSDTTRRNQFLADARFYSSSPTTLPLIELSKITKFVDPTLGFSFLHDDDPLPLDTIPMSLTETLDPNQLRTALGWQPLTMVDWIYHLTTSDLHHSKDIRKDAVFSQRVLLALNNLWPFLEPDDKAKIVSLLQDVDCVPTNYGHYKPKDAYFPEADLFNELVVVQLSRRVDSVLIALGVRKYVEWEEVEHRLDSMNYSMMRLVAYLQAVRPHMKDKFKTVPTLRIFASDTGTRHCIQELHYPDPINRTLGLPILRWNDEPVLGAFGAPTLYDVASEFLFGIGLQRYPSLEVIIKKASADDPEARQHAYNFFVNHLEDYYEKYTPASFSGSAFLPCGNGDEPEFGTPEEVFTSHEWEIFGFRTIHKSVPPTAKKWFDLLAREGGFSADDLAVISEMALVPVQLQPDGTYQESVDPPAVPPNRCFYAPPDPTKAHHEAIFAYVNYNEPANSLLKMCGAKPSPDCSDIVAAMIENPQEYLNKIKRFMDKRQLDKTHAYQRYLDDLSQVAAGYHSLSTELGTLMKEAPIFISFRKKRSVSDGPLSTESQEYALKPAHEIFIDDGLKSHQSFGEDFFVAPKGEVFEITEHPDPSAASQPVIMAARRPLVAPLGGTNDTSDPLYTNFFKHVSPPNVSPPSISPPSNINGDAPPPLNEARKKRSAKFRTIFTLKKKDGKAETQVQRLWKRPFKLHNILTRKNKDETQSQSDHQPAVVRAEADINPRPATPPQELIAKDKGKQKQCDPNPVPARHTGRASTHTTQHQPAAPASQTQHKLRERVAGIRQAIMRHRDGSTAQAQNRLENTPLADGNSTEHGDAAEPSHIHVGRDFPNRRPWTTFPKTTRNPEVVEIMEGQMKDRYVSGHKFVKKKRRSSVESGSGSGSGDTEDGAEDSGEDEREEEPRNKTPGGLIGMLCFCSCIP